MTELTEKEILNYMFTVYFTNLLNDSSLSQETFDNIHKGICDELKRIYGAFGFTYGQAQKWINMTLKYYYLLDKEKTKKAVFIFTYRLIIF
jgi:hypothetical protein